MIIMTAQIYTIGVRDDTCHEMSRTEILTLHALQHRNRKDAMMEKLKVTFDRVTFLKLIISWQEDVENMKRTLEANQEVERKKREELASCRSYYNEGGFKYDY